MTPDRNRATILAELIHNVDCLGAELSAAVIASRYGVRLRTAQRLLVALDQITPLVVTTNHEGWKYRKFRA